MWETADLAAGQREQALEIVDMLVRSGSVDIVVVDSVAALTPKRKLRRNGDAQMGLHAA